MQLESLLYIYQCVNSLALSILIGNHLFFNFFHLSIMFYFLSQQKSATIPICFFSSIRNFQITIFKSIIIPTLLIEIIS